MSQAGRLIAVALLLVGVGWAGTADAARAHKHRRRAHGHGQGHGHARSPAAAPAPAAAPTPTPPTAVAPSVVASTPAAVVATPVVSRPAPNAQFGRVQFVTDKRAYLDRGAAEGMAVGQSLIIARGVRAVGSCKVETVGDHVSTCVGGRLHAGDAFRVGRNGRKSQPPTPVMPPLVDDKTLEVRAAAVADATIDKVDFNGKHAFRGHATAEVSPGFAVWFTQPDAQGGTYAQERIDGTIRGVDIGGTGLRFDGSFSAVRWKTPPTLERFRPDTPTQFYLWEAEASRRSQEGGTTVAVGRLWPFHTPGLTLLDGIQLGRQNETRTAEGGLYGGLIPSAESLAPSFDIWAAGVYGALTQVGNKKSTVRLARQEARIGFWRAVNTSAVAEAEGLAQAWIGPVSTGGGGRIHWESSAGSHPVVERAYLDMGIKPSVDTGAGLHLRYIGAALLPGAPLRAELPMTNGALHGIADAHWNLTPSVAVAASAGVHRDGDSGRSQIEGGGELRFPRLFREGGGLWLGAEVEQGWMQGENVYVQFVGHYDAQVQVLARVSVNATRFETPTTIDNLDELGAYLNVDGALSSWLRVRAWSILRAPILVQGELPVDASFGAVVGLSLAGAI